MTSTPRASGVEHLFFSARPAFGLLDDRQYVICGGQGMTRDSVFFCSQTLQVRHTPPG
jgi:hypothetical protein